MEVIKLPSKLVDPLRAKEFNRRVREGSCTLDWSEISELDATALSLLLEALSLDADSDALGLSTIPEAIIAAVQAELDLQEKSAPRRPKAKKRSSAVSGSMPAVWVASPSSAPSSGSAPHVEAPAAAHPNRPKLDGLRPQELREEFVRLIVADLLGPASGETEELHPSDTPRDRYLVGVLAPRSQQLSADEDDEASTAGDESNEEGEPEPTRGGSMPRMFPSSMGLTFAVEAGAKLEFSASWGRYLRGPSEIHRSEKTDEPRAVWKREPMGCDWTALTIDDDGSIGPIVADPREPAVHLQGYARTLGNDRIISLFLVNSQQEPEKQRDAAWVFQPSLSVRGAPTSGDAAPFVARSLNGTPIDSELDEQISAMQYRERVEFAVGHNVAVEVTGTDEQRTRARALRTSVVPQAEVSAQQPRVPPSDDEPSGAEVDPLLTGLFLDMRALSTIEQASVRSALSPLTTAYKAWIDARERETQTPDATLKPHETAAREAIARCRRALERIERGIELLATDALALDAFRLANEAMSLQRTRSKFVEARLGGDPRAYSDFDTVKNRSWRTFQLAFLLLQIEPLTRLDHPDRAGEADAVADLLWFPTGGGKTEAYLGVAAYVIALRRLQGALGGRSGEHGVAVLMRYTLRLLTMQQFQRATALLCALEVLRRSRAAEKDKRWGTNPFRIGLWVGSKSTPNKTKDAEEVLASLVAGRPSGRGTGTPVQFAACPWCGSEINPKTHMRAEPSPSGRMRTFVFCGDRSGECPFSERQSPGEGLPILVVDEELYRNPPALLIATVDKFAQMAWRGDTGALFGLVSGRCPRHGFRLEDLEDSDSHPSVRSPALEAVKTESHPLLRPPDLIIQDELHLISGPLGTLAGLYETAVDELCTWTVDGRAVRPKIIASTATVRRARAQVRALFAREVEVFPPAGLDVRDNFFSVERSRDLVAGRRYVGVCAHGRRLKVALIRVYIAALAAAQYLYESAGATFDPWMTLVGYFSSLRELAGMRRALDDDVRGRLRRMENRGLAGRRIGEPQELTSRLPSTEIPRLLARLGRKFVPGAEPKGEERPIDVMLATNMISVGVDVSRLGLMVCAGQPKNTAEYIQATSRVGRDDKGPGVVLTVYHWARPRDLSHYETFEHYHRTFYRQVEALSVTPWAPRALDRGLSAVLVALTRHLALTLNPNSAAEAFSEDRDELRRAIDSVLRRVAQVEGASAVSEVRAAITARTAAWRAAIERERALRTNRLVFAKASEGEVPLLSTPTEPNARTPLFRCPTSLREVEPAVSLLLDEDGVDVVTEVKA